MRHRLGDGLCKTVTSSRLCGVHRVPRAYKAKIKRMRTMVLRVRRNHWILMDVCGNDWRRCIFTRWPRGDECSSAGTLCVVDNGRYEQVVIQLTATQPQQAGIGFVRRLRQRYAGGISNNKLCVYFVRLFLSCFMHSSFTNQNEICTIFHFLFH